METSAQSETLEDTQSSYATIEDMDLNKIQNALDHAISSRPSYSKEGKPYMVMIMNDLDTIVRDKIARMLHKQGKCSINYE